MSRFASSKYRFSLVAGFLLAFLLVFNFSTFTLYQRAKDYLDNELGERLRSIAVTLSHAVETATPATLDASVIEPALYTLLHQVRTENLLSNIVILTPEGRTVVDLGDVSRAGEPNPFIELDYTAVTLARSGLSAFTNLYRSGDIYMKSAYAPIMTDDQQVKGILGVEAGAAYFDVLRGLSRAIIFVDAISVLVIFVLGLFFYRLSLSLDKAQAAVIQGENLATMGRMVAGIAHEIRNPLSIIKTSSERLQKKYGQSDVVFSYISEEVDKLNGILTGYLNFARAERQDSRPQSVQKIIRRCLLILEPDARAKGIRVVEHLPESDVTVMGDDKRIQQAVLNVLLNAVQAVDKGGQVEISLENHGKSAVIIVRDTGPGIPQKHLRDVTKPFFTTKKDGSGLGMSIVSSVMQEHGGSLDIRSAPGHGTEIALAFPLAD
jgi:signal transduction histidine kinase